MRTAQALPARFQRTIRSSIASNVRTDGVACAEDVTLVASGRLVLVFIACGGDELLARFGIGEMVRFRPVATPILRTDPPVCSATYSETFSRKELPEPFMRVAQEAAL